MRPRAVARIAVKADSRGANLIRNGETKPQNNKTRRVMGGPVAGKAGEDETFSKFILSEKLNRCKSQFLAAAELSPKSCAPFGETLIPKGNACHDARYSAASASRSTVKPNAA
jgi:hypothetical protein